MDHLKSQATPKSDQMTVLLLVCIVLSSIFQQHADAKCLDPEKKKLFNQFSLTEYCRKHILSPACRGHQKRDVFSRFNDEYRFPQIETDITAIRKPNELGTLIKSPNLLGIVLRKTMEASTEYDSDNGNYIK